MTAKAGAEAASGPEAQQAQPEPARTTADQPSETAARANRTAATCEENGTNKHAGDGRCPEDGARQAQTEPPRPTRQTTRPEKRAGTEKNADTAMRHPQSQDPATQRGGNRASPRQERGDRDGKDPPHHQPPGGGGGLAQARPWARPRPGSQAVTGAGRRQTAKRGHGEPAPPGLPGRGRAVLRAQPDLPAAPGNNQQATGRRPHAGGRGREGRPAGRPTETWGKEAGLKSLESTTPRSGGRPERHRQGGRTGTGSEAEPARGAKPRRDRRIVGVVASFNPRPLQLG